MTIRRHTQLGALAIAACALAACNGQGALAPSAPADAGPVGASSIPMQRSATPSTRLHRATTPIQHIVIIVQENRSFDDLFIGYPNANTVTSGLNSLGQTIPLAPIPLEAQYDINHSFTTGFSKAYDKGKMDHFDKEGTFGPQHSMYPNPQYGYVPLNESGPYWSMAQQYVLDDNAFASDIDGSFVAHQYLIAGQSNAEVNYPNGPWGCTGGPADAVHQLTQQRIVTVKTVPPCQDYQTLGDELDTAGLSWRTYAPSVSAPYPESLWNGYQAIKHIYTGPDWSADNISPETQILTDVPNGYLAAVTWVIPDEANSDHALSDSANGPSWVANVVNAVGESPFWNSTAIFVLWDDWGGWYDHVAPKRLDYDGLGFRVPMICISPYALQGVVSHTQYEFGSVLRFVENNFGLGQLAASDKRATPADNGCMNYSQSPRPFAPITSSRSRSFFVHQRPSLRSPDDE